MPLGDTETEQVPASAPASQDPDPEALRAVIDGLQLLVITPFLRSGSLFFQSLFDDHPDTAVFMGMEHRYPLGDTFGQADIRPFIRKHGSYFSSRCGYLAYATSGGFGPKGDEDVELDTLGFRLGFENLWNILGEEQVSRRTFFALAHLALNQTLGRDPLQTRCAVFHLHRVSLEECAAMAADFPGVKLLINFRDPRESWVSWRAMLQGRYGGDALTDLVLHQASWCQALDILFTEAEKLGTDSVRLVDLNRAHASEGRVMDAIADWLGIARSPALVQSTVYGRSWPGNSTDGKAISGFDPAKAAYRFPEKIDPAERQLIEAWFAELIEAMDYAPVLPDNPWLAGEPPQQIHGSAQGLLNHGRFYVRLSWIMHRHHAPSIPVVSLLTRCAIALAWGTLTTWNRIKAVRTVTPAWLAAELEAARVTGRRCSLARDIEVKS